MGYFQVRYNSRVVNYDRRGFIRLATGVINYDRKIFLRLSTGRVMKANLQHA